MSTPIEAGRGGYVTIFAGPIVDGSRHVGLSCDLGNYGITLVLAPAKAIAVARALLSHAGVTSAGVTAPACIQCEREEHVTCGGPESGCGCAARGHA